jgi:hypothetical protein
MLLLDQYKIKNDRPGYSVTTNALANCKDCDCAQRLLRCQKAAPVEQHCTIFA